MTKNEPGCPDTIGGFLQVGETSTRQYSCPLAKEYAAVLQNQPGGGVKIVEQTNESITLENRGARVAGFLVHFPTLGMVQLFSGLKQAYDGARKHWGAKK